MRKGNIFFIYFIYEIPIVHLWWKMFCFLLYTKQMYTYLQQVLKIVVICNWVNIFSHFFFFCTSRHHLFLGSHLSVNGCWISDSSLSFFCKDVLPTTFFLLSISVDLSLHHSRLVYTYFSQCGWVFHVSCRLSILYVSLSRFILFKNHKRPTSSFDPMEILFSIFSYNSCWASGGK